MRDSLIADSGDIKFECSQCGQRMVVERSAAGFLADCPMCNTPVTVPHIHAPVDLGKGEAPALEPAIPVRSKREPGRESAHPIALEVELAEAQAEVVRQHALFKKAVDECERLKANTTHVQAELKSFQADRQQLKADLAQARQVAAVAEARASELADTLSAVQEENGALRYQAEVDVNALRERVSAVETLLAAREQELASRQAEHTDALRSLAKTRAEHSKLNTEAAGLRSEVEILRSDFETATQELATTSQQLSETKGRWETLAEEHRKASAERDDWRQQAEQFRHDLTALDSGRDLLELRTRHEELQAAAPEPGNHARRAHRGGEKGQRCPPRDRGPAKQHAGGLSQRIAPFAPGAFRLAPGLCAFWPGTADARVLSLSTFSPRTN